MWFGYNGICYYFNHQTLQNPLNSSLETCHVLESRPAEIDSTSEYTFLNGVSTNMPYLSTLTPWTLGKLAPQYDLQLASSEARLLHFEDYTAYTAGSLYDTYMVFDSKGIRATLSGNFGTVCEDKGGNVLLSL